MPNTFVQKGNTRMEVAVSALPVWLAAGWSEQAASAQPKPSPMPPVPAPSPAPVQSPVQPSAPPVPSPAPAAPAPTTVQQPSAAPQTQAVTMRSASGDTMQVMESDVPYWTQQGFARVAKPSLLGGGQQPTTPTTPQVNKYGHTMEQANDPANWTTDEMGNQVYAPAYAERQQNAKAEAEAKQATAEQERQSKLNAILEKYGIGQQDDTKSPVNRAMEAYKTVLESLGVPTVSAKMAEIEKEYAALQEQKRVEAAEIEDNPWLVEGVRRDRLAAVDRKYEAKETNLTGRLAQFKDIYDQGVEQAKYVSGMAVQEQEAKDALKEKMATLEMESLFKKADMSADVEGYLTALETGFKGDFVDYKNAIAGRDGNVDLPVSAQEYEYYAGQTLALGLSPMTYDEWMTVDANRKNRLGTDTGGMMPLVNTILENPSLFSQLTATDKAAVAPILNGLGFTGFGKPLSDTAIKEITQSETAIEQLGNLKSIIETNPQYIGPISGIQSLNPWSDAKKVQAQINLVKQMVGKSLEGGVLRKEDEEKYKKILATMFDTPDTALAKVNNLIATIKADVERYKNNQALSGRSMMGDDGNSGDDPLGILPKADADASGSQTAPAAKKTGGSVSWRNNNPLNIKYGTFSKGYGATEGTKATDGGAFASFPDEATGLKAARDLLKGKSYANLTLDAAMKRWSNNGYGADVAPPQIRNKKIAQMSDAEVDSLIAAMRKREGWKEGNKNA